MRKVAVVAMLIARATCLLFWISPTAQANDKKDVRTTKPLLVLTGADSHLDKTAYHRVASADEFKKLWLGHLGMTADAAFRDRAPTLDVDFDRYMVIAIFQCEKVYSRGLDIDSVIEAKDRVTLRFVNLASQVAFPLGAVAPAIPVTPAYAFVVLPKSAKVVILEEGLRELKNQPPEWKERARLKGEEATEKR